MPKRILQFLFPAAIFATVLCLGGCGDSGLPAEADELRAQMAADSLLGPLPEETAGYLRARRDSLMEAATEGKPEETLPALLELNWLYGPLLRDKPAMAATANYIDQWTKAAPGADRETDRYAALIARANFLYRSERSKRPDGLKLLREAGAIKQKRGGSHPFDGYYYFHLAVLRDMMDDFDGVEAQYDSAAAHFDRLETRLQHYQTLREKAGMIRHNKPTRAIRLLLRCRSYFEEMNDPLLYQYDASIGLVYLEQNNLAAAEKYLRSVLARGRELDREVALGFAYIKLSELYLKRARVLRVSRETLLDTALAFQDSSALYYAETGKEDQVLITLDERANILLEMGRTEEAFALADSIMPIFKAQTIFGSYASAALAYATASRQLGRFEPALDTLNAIKDLENIDYESRVNARREIVHSLLARENDLDVDTAFQDYIVMRNLFESTTSRRLAEETAAKYESDKKDEEIARRKADLKRKNQLLWAAAGVGLVILCLLGMTGWFYRRQKAAGLQLASANAELVNANEEISTSREEIRSTLEELSIKQDILERAFDSISESIAYASRIQQAMLPRPEALDRLPPYFIWYKPRDVVSGDIYWAWKPEHADAAYFAVIDCTGHGVPGAFMSVLARANLDQIVARNENISPEKALDQLARDVREALQQFRDDSAVLDGMDMTLCRLELASLRLTFASAGRPLYIDRGEEIEIFKGDRFPVGGGQHQSERFALNETTLRPGNRLFLFTDGITDQFGGEKKRKYTPKRLQKFIEDARKLSLSQTEAAFADEFSAWQKGAVQLDDQTLLAIEIPATGKKNKKK